MNPELRAALIDRGASDDEIDRAEAGGWIVALALDRVLLPGVAEFTSDELAARAGVDKALAADVWRSLGFPSVGDARSFSEQDATMLALFAAQGERSVLTHRPIDEHVHTARLIAGSLAKIAEQQADLYAAGLRHERERGESDDEIALRCLEEIDWAGTAELIDYTLRLLLRDAIWRRMVAEQSDEVGTLELAVGFVDLVGYTVMSQQLDDTELAALVGRFETLAHDTVVHHGGRVVKTIGDEVMFVADDIGAAVSIAYELTRGVATDPDLPQARSGVAAGRVLARDGDYYGPVVNFAHRLTSLAFAGSVVTDDAVHAALADREGFEWTRLRARKVRDIGVVEAFRVNGVPNG